MDRGAETVADNRLGHDGRKERRIDFLVRDIPNARSGFRILFSAPPLHGYQKRLVWQREEFGGNWYACDDEARFLPG